MNELQPLIDILAAKHGWVSAAVVWIGALRVAIKPFNAKVQSALTNALAAAKSDPEEAAWLHDKILSRSWYRLFAFLGDLLFSVKLPTHADFHAAVTAIQSSQPPVIKP